MRYPAAPRADVVERLHDVNVADPFRPLERAEDPLTLAWVAAQNALTRSALDTPHRTNLVARLERLHRYRRRSLPALRGSRTFFTENDGTRNQAALVVESGSTHVARPEGPRDEPSADRVVIVDPNVLDPAGTTAITAFEPSDDGARVVYALSQGGSDLQELSVFDVGSGRLLPDRIAWAKFVSLAWAAGGDGFFYTRFPEPGTVAPGDEQYFCQVRFHRLGDPQSADVLVYHRPDAREIVFDVDITSDGRWLVIISRHGATDEAEVHIIAADRAATGGTTESASALITGFTAGWHFIDGRLDTLYFHTDDAAPMGRVVRFDVAAPRQPASAGSAGCATKVFEIVAESTEKIDSAAVAGGRLLIATLKNATSRVCLRDLDGANPTDVSLPDLGTVTGLSARWDDPLFHVGFTSFTTPPVVLRGLCAGPERPGLRATFDAGSSVRASDYLTEQVWYPSRDGTLVSMFLVSRRVRSGPAVGAALLTGYGGFNISITPQFDPSDIVWLDAGGVIAVTNLRGGGEYGEAWHRAGMRERKQNVFDDFLAAAEWLIANGRAQAGRVAIEGGSNGGLLVGAATVQRPELFGAAICRVPVADMLRYHLFTVGRFWIPEYGCADEADAFKYLYRYSPYHNVRDGVRYPPTLVMTADTDDRVDPGMAKKFAARLQEASAGGIVLLRVEPRAGHGAGKSRARQIEEQADICEFLFQHLTEATHNEQ